MAETKRILVTVKTYPHPSQKHRELVCVAGVQEDGSFIRLYPVPFRYLEKGEQFAKYQWIELQVARNSKDHRPESFRPIPDTIHLGEKISAKGNWAERKRLVLPKSLPTMCGLQERPQTEVSLGIIKPREIRFSIEQVEPDWDEKYKASLQQQNFLIDRETKKALEKIPYRFSFQYRCMKDDCKGHDMTITDWEIGVLYLRQFKKHNDPKKAIEDVRQKFLNDLCGADKDTHFFVGTVNQYGSWIIIGVFYPKKGLQKRFDFEG